MLPAVLGVLGGAGKQLVLLSVSAGSRREEGDASLRGIQGRYQGPARSGDAGNPELGQQDKPQRSQLVSYSKRAFLPLQLKGIKDLSPF